MGPPSRKRPSGGLALLQPVHEHHQQRPGRGRLAPEVHMLAYGLIEPQVRHLHGEGQGSTGFGFVDPLVTTTLYRCRNYDVVTGANRFDASEVPAGLAKYAQESTCVCMWRNLRGSTSGRPRWLLRECWRSWRRSSDDRR